MGHLLSLDNHSNSCFLPQLSVEANVVSVKIENSCKFVVKRPFKPTVSFKRPLRENATILSQKSEDLWGKRRPLLGQLKWFAVGTGIGSSTLDRLRSAMGNAAQVPPLLQLCSVNVQCTALPFSVVPSDLSR